MKLLSLILYLIVFMSIQGFVATHLQDKNLTLQERLELINKPAVKSFVTEYGDILDCVEIKKQLAFDHLLLKNHSIQMKPTNFTKLPSSKDNRLFLSSHPIPKSMRCPHGTVPIRRILEEDLLMNENPPILGINSAFPISDYNPETHDAAALVAFVENWGAHGFINVWNPSVQPGQHTAGSVFVAKNDGSVSNAIQAGWMASPYLNSDKLTRIYGYWTKDSGKSTGCYNVLCPGFVQISQRYYFGQQISPISEFNGIQCYVKMGIEQDGSTGNWWLFYDNQGVGYWPREIFTSLAGMKAGRAGWGGEIYNHAGKNSPPWMGSGFKALAGFAKSCFVSELKLANALKFPDLQDLKYFMTNPNSYNVTLGQDDPSRYHIFFGGPQMT